MKRDEITESKVYKSKKNYHTRMKLGMNTRRKTQQALTFSSSGLFCQSAALENLKEQKEKIYKNRMSKWEGSVKKLIIFRTNVTF